MAPACGGGPSNWNCLLATMEPILPFSSVKIPLFKVNCKVPSVLHETVSTGSLESVEDVDVAEEVEVEDVVVTVVA